MLPKKHRRKQVIKDAHALIKLVNDHYESRQQDVRFTFHGVESATGDVMIHTADHNVGISRILHITPSGGRIQLPGGISRVRDLYTWLMPEGVSNGWNGRLIIGWEHFCAMLGDTRYENARRFYIDEVWSRRPGGDLVPADIDKDISVSRMMTSFAVELWGRRGRNAVTDAYDTDAAEGLKINVIAPGFEVAWGSVSPPAWWQDKDNDQPVHLELYLTAGMYGTQYASFTGNIMGLCIALCMTGEMDTLATAVERYDRTIHALLV